MYRKNLEERVAKLERALLYKNEFLGFGKPKKSDEPKFLKSLFNKYKTLENNLSQLDRADA